MRRRKQEVPERQRRRLSIARYHTHNDKRKKTLRQQRKHTTHNMRTDTTKDHMQMSIAIGCP